MPEQADHRSPRTSRAGFVTVCQQLLALGLIVAVLTPAASVVSLDVLPERPAGSSPLAAGVPVQLAAYAKAAEQPSLVPAEVVDAEVEEHQLTAPEGARVSPRGLAARTAVQRGGGSTVTSEPQPVEGYGAVGVTWAHGEEVEHDGIRAEVRMQTGAEWSGWTPIEYHDEHGPDPDSVEGRRARPGTDALLVGEVDQVQVRVTTAEAAPADMKLAVIDPGEAERTAVEGPALDTADGQAPEGSAPPAANGLQPVPGQVAERGAAAGDDAGDDAGDEAEEDAAALQAAVRTPKPKIYSRAQWGANERMRDPGSLSYFEVHAGFVHHTVNANNYTRAQVPGIIRGIYAYHTRSRGWSDVGYNFLVDRFGRIWEGRAGGVDRPVVGAHTLGYNENSFAMSAIGNFDVARPGAALVQAYGALFAWKLSLHGVTANDASQAVGPRRFRAVNGHRDAGSTACPGRYLYAKLPQIRVLATRAQRGWDGRQLESDLGSTKYPDIVVRRARDGRGFVVPLWRKRDGSFTAGRAIDTGHSLAAANRIMNAGDWDRNGYADIMYRHRTTGALHLLPRSRTGFGAPVVVGRGFGRVGLLAAVGDATGDGWPDLVGQPAGGSLRLYNGWGLKGIPRSYVATGRVAASRQVAVGRWDADGAPDSLFRSGGSLRVMLGNGPGGFTGSARPVPGLNVAAYDWVIGIDDVRVTGQSDLLVRNRTNGRLYLIERARNRFSAPRVLGRIGYGGYDLAG